MSEERQPIIIKRRRKTRHKHHGGAWKIALADFMTALMALFLVLWILSMASEEQRQGVAEYFRTPLAVAMAGGDRPTASTSQIRDGGADATHSDGEVERIFREQQNRPAEIRRQFERIRRQIRQSIVEDEQLRDFQDQIRLDITLQGLRIQLLDTAERAMFEMGSDQVEPYMADLLQNMAPVLNELPNELTITGHTDSVQFAAGYQEYSNWELSADRANSSRRELVAGGFDSGKLLMVSGVADRIPMQGTEPRDPRNRRITLVVHTTESAEIIRSQGMLEPLQLNSLDHAAGADEAPILPADED